MTTLPLNWIKTVEGAVDKLKVIPMWGYAPSFHFDRLAEKLKEILSIDICAVSLEGISWKKKEEFFAGLGTSPVITALEIPPLQDLCYWALASEDVQKIVKVATSQEKLFTSFHKTIQEGFYQYLLLEVLQKMDEDKIVENISPRLSSQNFSLQGDAFAIDVKILLGQEELVGRILCSESFHNHFTKHFSERKGSLLDNPHIQDVNIHLHAEIAMTSLTMEEMRNLHVGDFVLLERCSFDPDSHKGHISLSMAGIPIYQARYKDDSIKIIDYAVYYEEESSMTNDENPESFSDAEEPIDFEEELGGEPTPPLQEAQSKKVEALLSTDKVPCNLHVEIGTISLTIEKLLELQPGNLLELPMKPEDGVHLTLHGKKIAKGELVKIGETLGVKILELGQ